MINSIIIKIYQIKMSSSNQNAISLKVVIIGASGKKLIYKIILKIKELENHQ